MEEDLRAKRTIARDAAIKSHGTPAFEAAKEALRLATDELEHYIATRNRLKWLSNQG